MSTLTGDIWSKLEFELSEFRDLFHMRLETKDEARGERISPANPKTGKKAKWRGTGPRWDDPDVGKSVRPWLMIPYVDGIEQEELRERLDAGKRLLTSVEQRIATRDLTPELMHDWGRLSRYAGALQLIYQTEPNVGRLREGADNLDGHKRWFAEYFLRVYTHGEMEEARDKMEHFINSTIQNLPKGSEREWFSRFLSNEPSDRWGNKFRRLTGAFREDLSVAEMKRLIKQPPGNIPNLKLDFPPP